MRLAYDPHVSRIHVHVHRAGDGMHWAEGLPGATNPALLDFRALTPGKPERLVPGAVLSVGSTRFVFRGV